METNQNELFSIDHSSEHEVIRSFERISKELFNNYSIKINESVFHFTEIEFYYFHEGINIDNNTHPHKLSIGKWRGHNQGLDITFDSNNEHPYSDGGILIRGIKQVEPITDKPYVNGSRRVIFKIFESLNDVMTINSGVYLVKLQTPLDRKIFRTSRQNLKEETYKDSKYRYFTEQEDWRSKQWDGKYNFSNDNIINKSTWEEVL